MLYATAARQQKYAAEINCGELDSKEPDWRKWSKAIRLPTFIF